MQTCPGFLLGNPCVRKPRRLPANNAFGSSLEPHPLAHATIKIAREHSKALTISKRHDRRHATGFEAPAAANLCGLPRIVILDRFVEKEELTSPIVEEVFDRRAVSLLRTSVDPLAHRAHHSAKPQADIAMAGVHRQGLLQVRMIFIAKDSLSSTSYLDSTKTLVFPNGENPAQRPACSGFSGRKAYPGSSDSLLTPPFQHPHVRVQLAALQRARHQYRDRHPWCAPPPPKTDIQLIW